ncbi:site-specific integrase [Paenibacillus peoriae]|uniref:site-specific integrase n=1 Tax=Paenibacillus peoriae TaxID=59893 RepID=UPI00096FBE51|nr:site-specific integrase [Paenibacillus peoriae]OMF79836.1 site-specific integrase [Paenibacillus peoriae]
MANFKKHNTGWEYRLKYKDPFTDKFREKSGKGFRTKKEAEDAAADMKKKLEEKSEQGDISLSFFLDEWLNEYKKGNVRKNTLNLHEYNIEKHIKPHFKKMTLQKLKPLMYQKFINKLSESKGRGDKVYSRRTVELIHSTMHDALEKAVTLGKLDKNPCEGVTIRGIKKSDKVKFIESEHIPEFLANAKKYGYIYWFFFMFMLETGMRKGEVGALQWPDIDLKNGLATVSKTLDYDLPENPDDLFGDTKTFNSKRTIKISNTLLAALRHHLNVQNQNKITLGEMYRHDLNLIMCRTDGSPIPKSSLFNSFSRIIKRAGLPPLPIHSLRHTHAVFQLEAGAEMKYVQERLGHGSIQITSDIYAHISKKIEMNNMEKYESFTENLFR